MTAIIEHLMVTGASEDDWRHRSGCRNREDSLFFPETMPDTEDEPPYVSPDVEVICSMCPVRSECLGYALANRIEFGVYGGMTGYQRGLLLKRRSRQRCPGCGSDEVITLGRDQVCIACGISWDVSVPPDDNDDNDT